jgi:CheY-like chemotaxis protein
MTDPRLARSPPAAPPREDASDRCQPARECFFSDACIVAVDDEQSSLVLLQAMLSPRGYSNVVLTTESANVGSLCADLSPDLILLDLHMAKPDGFELLDDLSHGNRLRRSA